LHHTNVLIIITVIIIIAFTPNTSDEVLAWLSVWNEVQMICIWSR